VSIQPDLIVDALDHMQINRQGAIMFAATKTPDPNSCKLEETRVKRGEKRRELARYLVALMQLLLEGQPAHARRAKIDLDLCFVADVRLGERIGAVGDHTARVRAIRRGCDQIARLWPTIKPKPSILRGETP
jgi:hypothetical protein